MTVSVKQAQVDELMKNAAWTYEKVGDKTTLTTCTLPNGFVLTESSSCIDPANYDHELGISICEERIEQKLWMLEGYRVSCAMHAAKQAQVEAGPCTEPETVTAWLIDKVTIANAEGYPESFYTIRRKEVDEDLKLYSNYEQASRKMYEMIKESNHGC